MLSTATAASLMAASLCYLWQRRVLDDVTRDLDAKRLEERTGRIRAEVKLRNALNREKQLSDSAGEVHSSNSHDAHAMKLSTIGKIVSPFTKRMGTPRQGMSPAREGTFNSPLRCRQKLSTVFPSTVTYGSFLPFMRIHPWRRRRKARFDLLGVVGSKWVSWRLDRLIDLMIWDCLW